MRKCIDLESQPGFQQIYSPVMQQAIDRGLEGHSGAGVIDWGYDLKIPGTTPTKGGPKPTKKPPREPPIPPNLTDPVITGASIHYNNIFNRYVTRVARQLINKFPKPTIRGYNSPHVGEHNAFKGKWGHIKTSKGWGGNDSSTLIHEYGHALDNIAGQFLTGTDEKMQSSLQLLKAMEIDGKKLGLVLDDSIYWSYLKENGISFRPDPNGKRKINIKVGSTRQEAENKMHGGDHWRIMAEMLRVTKEDMNKANLSKDPVQMLRTKKLYDSVAKLYDAHIARMEKIKQIKKEATKLHRKLQKENPYNEASGDGSMFSHLGDIIDALTGGEVIDWEKANNVYWKKGAIVSTFGHHGSGYYSMRRQEEQNGDYKYARNYRMENAMGSRRKEIWAQMFTFWSSHDTQFQNHVAKLLPNIHRDFTKAINRAVKFKMGSSINLNRNQSPDLSQAEIESLIDRSATPEYFHGTSTPIERLDYSTGPFNIYGSGLYTTMDKGVALKYTKKGKGSKPTVYKVTEINPGPSLDLETTPATFAKETLGEEFEDEWFEGKSLREALDEFRNESSNLGFPAWEVKEAMDSIFDKAYRQGYKSVTHEGGKITGGKKHTVKIFMRPMDDVRLKRVYQKV